MEEEKEKSEIKEIIDKKKSSDINVRSGSSVSFPHKNKKKVNNKVLSVVRSGSSVSSVSKDNKDITDKKVNGQEVAESLGFRILGKIIFLFYNKSPQSYKSLSEELDTDYDTIIKTMSRNKDYFQEVDAQGKIKFFKLSQSGEKFVQEKIETQKKKQSFVAKSMREEEERLKEESNLQNEIKSLTETLKLDRREKTININFEEILSLNAVVADKILDDPDKIVEIFKLSFETDYNIIFKNLPKSSLICIEEIRQKHIDKLITIEARSVSLSSVRPVIKNAKFECPSCGTIISVRQDLNLKSPNRCSCGRRGAFKMISKEGSNTSNIMLEDLQEKTENPHLQRIRGIIQDDLTEQEKITIFTPGNELKIVGVVREVPIFVRGQQSTTLNFIFEILYAELFEPEIDVSNFTKEEKDKITKLAEEINAKGLSEINSSFAPDIYGCEEIKNALILQLCNKRNNPSKSIRNKSNILLIGDPGTAKSVLCNFSFSITPRSKKAVGGGSSAVGITASVVKEEESLGGYRVEAGALVLAKELLIIDELNNLSDEDKPKLQEGMSEQRVSINKANQHLTLRVVAGILAAANPKHGSFKSNENIIVQFNIPSPIINRFDVIFTIRDIVEEKRDEEIAKRMIEREREKIKPKYPKEFLRKFFVYIRSFIEPKIDEGVAKKLRDFYLVARKNKTDDLLINPRFMETLTRLIKASAKIRLSKYIETKDIQRAYEILKESHFQISQYKLFRFEDNKVPTKYDFVEKPVKKSDDIPAQLQDDRLGDEAERLNKEGGVQ